MIVPPSNPVVSVGTILGVPGIRDAVRETAAPVIGLSPIIGTGPVRGMADKVLATVGVASTASAVARYYGSRASGGVLDGWLIDTSDAIQADSIAGAGIHVQAVPLWIGRVHHRRDGRCGAEPRGGRTAMRKHLEVFPVTGLPEVAAGDDLAALIGDGTDLRDGDVVSVTSKIVSKAEGRLTHGTRQEAIDAELVRVVAQRGETRIVQTRHGLVMAAAGTDTSNTAPGTVLLLPADPDESARQLRTALKQRYDVNVGIVITDTLGRPWRNGQTDLAIGAAGVRVVEDLRGTTDSHGNVLAVTEPALADEIASASELVKGKADGVPVAVLRGLQDAVLPAGEHGPGARALVRDADQDMFSLGTREAARAAVLERLAPTGPREVDPALWAGLLDEVEDIHLELLDNAVTVFGDEPVAVGVIAERLAVLLHAEGYGVTVRTGPGSEATVTFGSRSR